MIRLALSSLRLRAAAGLATLVAVMVGTALAATCGGLLESAVRLDAPPQRLGGAPIVVTGPADFHFPDGSGSAGYPERPVIDPALTARVASVPSVAKAVPDSSFPAAVLHDGAPVGDGLGAGHAWASAALTPYILDGTPPRTAEQVVLDATTARAAHAARGGRVTIVVDGRPGQYTVTGIAQATRPVGAAAVFFADARGHAPQAIGVLPEPGVSPIALAATLRSALPSTVAVRTGDSRGLGEFAGVSGSRLRLILVAGVFGGLVLVVMALVVAGTMTVSLRQRHRELALLRASGATPFQVRRLVLDETLLVALVGVLGGLALGRLAGARLFDALTDHGVVPSAVRFAQGPIPLAAAAIVALVTVRVAAGLAARPAVLVRPVQALREAAIAPGRLAPLRLWLAAVLAVGTVGLAGTTMFMTPTNAAALGGPAELTGAIAVGLVAPSVVRRAAAWFSRFVRRSGPDIRLAAVNLDVRAAQFGAVLTPIVLATSIALGNVYSQTTQDAATRAAYLDPLRADVVVTGDVGGIDPALAARLSALPGVTGSAELSDGSGWIEQPFDHSHTSDAWPLLGLSAQTGMPVYTDHVRAGSLGALRGDTIALPTVTADDLHRGVGDTVRIRFGDGGTAEVRVVAIVDQRSGYERLLLPAGLLAAHTASGLPGQLLLRGDDTVRAEVERLVRNEPGLRVAGRSAVAAGVDAGAGMQAWINYLVAALAIAYAAIAVLNTLAVSVLDRRREFGLQALSGATRRQIHRMLGVEGLVLTGLGLAVGTVVAAFTVLPIVVATGELLPSGPVWVLPAVVAAMVLLVFPTTVLSARLALRGRPIDAVS